MQQSPVTTSPIAIPQKIIRTLLIFGLVLALGACSSLPPNEDHIASNARAAKINATEVVFIHGMFLTPNIWEAWLPLFEKAGFTVSAPAWPLHDTPIARTNDSTQQTAMAKLQLEQVVEHYRMILRGKPVKPILVGHSMGGLVAQKLLQEGLAQAAVVINSAPPKGILFVSWPFIKSNWKIINPFADSAAPIVLTREDVAYSFANQQSDAVIDAAMAKQIVPESRQVGKDALGVAGAIDPTQVRGPMLIIAGAEDRTIPAALNYKNFELYRKSPADTDFLMFPNRDHLLIAGAGWEEIANASLRWIKAQKPY